jgi:hypothetical protein
MEEENLVGLAPLFIGVIGGVVMFTFCFLTFIFIIAYNFQ